MNLLIISNVSRECLAIGTPVIANYDDDIHYIYPENYPIFRANNSNDLISIFQEMYHWNNDDRTNHKNKILLWFKKYMDHKSVIDGYERELRYLNLIQKYKTRLPFPFSLFGSNKL